MKTLLSSALAFAVMALAGWSVSSAQTVYFSGHVYHVRACPGPVQRGVALCEAHIVTDSRGVFLTNRVSRDARGGVSPAGYGPASLTSAYNVPSGAGSPSTVVAIVDAYGYPNAASDLATYRSQYRLPACTQFNGCLTIVNETGGSQLPPEDLGWAQEQAIDLDMVSAFCPRCRILLVQATTNQWADLGAAVNYAAARAHSVGNSYAGTEAGTQSFEADYDHPGVAITAGTGDWGYASGPQFPASSPHVTAVGGTTLTQSNTRRGWTETVWAGAGSGCSQVYSEPSWQQPSNTNMANNTLCTMRMMSDVSAVADPNTAVAVYGPANSGRGSAWLLFGGTSVSTQIISAIYAINDGPVTFGSNPYSANPAFLNDVTSGSTGSCGGTYFCTAGSGYDGPTGLGTPNGVGAF